ncbi:MAG: sugar ABC transporter ATP-binding protein [Pirellula sp.]|nr:sugar ABC transporter ATP-binding protein [Pirellula sp.]
MPTLLEVRGIRKQFPGVLALDQIELAIQSGESVAIVGENGAGKSTLMKILAGVYTADSGQMWLDERPINRWNATIALQSGVVLIHQELNLAENLTVVDNLFLGHECTWGGPLGFCKSSAMKSLASEMLQRVGLPERFANLRVESLAPGQKQLVEIARALGQNARLLIMDEPTSSLTQAETDRLAEVMDDLKRSGVAILYISHRLAEVRRSCDRAIVLRDGRNVGTIARSDMTHDTIVRMMVGRDLKQLFPRTQRYGNGEVVLQLQDVEYADRDNQPISLVVRAGEVLGMAGLMGAGRTELAEAVFGIRGIRHGSVRVSGQEIAIRSPADAIQAGILLVPEDRRLHGLVLESSVASNLSLPNLDYLAYLRFISRSLERALSFRMIQELQIKTSNAQKLVGELSGGNQQKVVFGKWLTRGPKVLILDEPTRGVDVGARSEIYRLIDELAGRGVAVWMISSDMEELLGMSDRVVVLHEGRYKGELTRAEISEEAVMQLATGGGSES